MTASQATDSTLRLLTWNILGARGCAVGTSGPTVFPDPHPAVIAGIGARLRAWELDLVLLQEAPPEAQLSALAEASGMHAAFFPAQAASGPDYPFGFPGAILAREPLTEVTDRAALIRHPGDPRLERHWGSARHAGLRFDTVHLCGDWGGVNREAIRQAELAAILTNSDADILAGDCNAVPDSPTYQTLAAASWRDAWSATDATGLTADARYPTVRIDQCWLSPRLRCHVHSAQVLDHIAESVDGQDILLSDHFPVLVRLRLGAPSLADA